MTPVADTPSSPLKPLNLLTLSAEPQIEALGAVRRSHISRVGRKYGRKLGPKIRYISTNRFVECHFRRSVRLPREVTGPRWPKAANLRERAAAFDNSGDLELRPGPRRLRSGQLTQLVEAALGAFTDKPGASLTPEPDPKLLLADLPVGAKAGGMDVARLASTIEKLLFDMFKVEAIATRSDGDRGCLVLNVTIRAFEEGKPGCRCLRFERLCLDLRFVTGI